MKGGWQRRQVPHASVLAAMQAIPPASCVLGMRGAGHQLVDATLDVGVHAAHYFLEGKPLPNGRGSETAVATHENLSSAREQAVSGPLPCGRGSLTEIAAREVLSRARERAVFGQTEVATNEIRSRAYESLPDGRGSETGGAAHEILSRVRQQAVTGTWRA